MVAVGPSNLQLQADRCTSAFDLAVPLSLYKVATCSAGGLSQANLLISASSPDAILGGQQLAQAVEGVATFSSLIITANESIASGPQNYTIQFAATSNPDIQPWSISVNLRCAWPKNCLPCTVHAVRKIHASRTQAGSLYCT